MLYVAQVYNCKRVDHSYPVEPNRPAEELKRYWHGAAVSFRWRGIGAITTLSFSFSSSSAFPTLIERDLYTFKS